MRNINCRHYSPCLRSAALRGLRDLPCQSCKFKDDNSYKMSQQDIHGLVKLVARAWGSSFDLYDPLQAETCQEKGMEDFSQDKFGAH